MEQETRNTFLQASQDTLHSILNERKSILHTDVKKGTAREALTKVLSYWKDDFRPETLESKEYEEALEAQKNVLSLSLIYKSLAEDHEASVVAVGEETQIYDQDSVEHGMTEDQDSVENENCPPEIVPERTAGKSLELNLQQLSTAFKRICDRIEKGPDNETNMVKSITIARRTKTQLIIVTLILTALNSEIPSNFERICANFFSKEELYSSFLKVLPKAYNYNLFMKYYQPFLQSLFTNSSITDIRLRNDLISSIETVVLKQFPQYPLSFDERHEIVMKRLGMESFSLEDCCDRIETRASVMSLEAPIEMAQKMRDIWLLLEASKFLNFDDNCMTIYVFSSELPVFHEQIMRIFYVINRIDEAVREVGYASYATPKFVSFYTTIYTEMHSWFVSLVRALSRSYVIYELESDKITGAIRRKEEMTPFIAAKLKELCIFMTCPLASLDSTLRLSIEVEDIPILFGDEEERFIFTAPAQNILVLHDFVASDREQFAKHTVELYPCLDRHFSRFHKSKKGDSRGPNDLSLPPSYHLFAKSSKPPEYEYYQTITRPENDDLDLEAQNDFSDENQQNCCSFGCKHILPGLLFLSIGIGIIIIAANN